MSTDCGLYSVSAGHHAVARASVKNRKLQAQTECLAHERIGRAAILAVLTEKYQQHQHQQQQQQEQEQEQEHEV